MTMNRWISGAAVAAAALVLAACGGSDDEYGAIAVSESTARVGIATESVTQSRANERAREKCDAKDCTVVLQFRQCGAVASGKNVRGALIIAAAEGGSAYDAQTAANNICTAEGGRDCDAIPNLPAKCN